MTDLTGLVKLLGSTAAILFVVLFEIWRWYRKREMRADKLVERYIERLEKEIDELQKHIELLMRKENGLSERTPQTRKSI